MEIREIFSTIIVTAMGILPLITANLLLNKQKSIILITQIEAMKSKKNLFYKFS